MGCHFLLQRIFLTQGSNQGSPALPGKFLTTESPTISSFKNDLRISPGVQSVGIHLPTQGTWVWSLVQGVLASAGHGATKPRCHGYGAHLVQPLKLRHSSWNCWNPCALELHTATSEAVTQLLNPGCPEPLLHNKREASTMRSSHTKVKSSPCSPQLEKAHRWQWRPAAAQNKQNK